MARGSTQPINFTSTKSKRDRNRSVPLDSGLMEMDDFTDANLGVVPAGRKKKKKKKINKPTQLQIQKREADKIRAGGSDRARKRRDQGMMGPSAGDTPKPLAPKVAPRPRPKPSRLTGGGMDAELLATPAGVTSGRVKKTARSSETSGEGFDPGEFKTTAVIKSDPTEGGMYAFTPKDSKSIMGMTQKGYDEMMGDSSGEKRGGRPGRGKLKTQGMNKKGKRKAGFSGKGAGAALRGF